MFKSFRYKICLPKTRTRQYLYEIEDSEFGIVKGASDLPPRALAAGSVCATAVVIAIEYSKRGLDVGKNLAVFIIWYCERYGHTVNDICNYQDDHCPRYFPNWKEIAASRDEYLAKLLLL